MWPNNYTPRYIARTIENICSHKNLYTNVYSSIIHSSQKIHNSQISINCWMDKHMVYLYNGVLFTHEKEWSADTCYNINKPWKHYAKWKKPFTKDHVIISFIRNVQNRKIHRDRMSLPGSRGRLWMGIQFCFGGEIILELDSIMAAQTHEYTKKPMNFTL